MQTLVSSTALTTGTIEHKTKPPILYHLEWDVVLKILHIIPFQRLYCSNGLHKGELKC